MAPPNSTVPEPAAAPASDSSSSASPSGSVSDGDELDKFPAKKNARVVSIQEEVSEPTSSSEEAYQDAKQDVDEEESYIPPTIRLSLVPLQAASATKAPLQALPSWVALALTLDGRDKITKVVQYTARFLAFYWTTQKPRWQALQKSITTSRKAYRLGRTLIEYHRLSTMGLWQTLGFHWQQSLEQETPPPPINRKILMRRISSNIGWGPATAEEEQQKRPRLLHKLSSMAFRRMYRPTASFAETTTSLWHITGAAIKLLGLAGFWTADNVNFLTSTGVFDNYKHSTEERLARRKRLQARAGRWANRSYFIGAVAGLLVNLRSYLRHKRETELKLQEQMDEAEDDDQVDTVYQLQDKAEQKQFALCLALLKSCCDVLVFSNNPGIDLWKRYLGFKNHEGVHCVAGLLSASTVLYNNFPNAKVSK